ncbi:hypothetical protein MXB_1430, partial [Myxobolus squamalis]
GIEYFVNEELKLITDGSVVDSFDGRLVFESEKNLSLILQLKTVERVFYCIYFERISFDCINSTYLLNLMSNEKIITNFEALLKEKFVDAIPDMNYRINIKAKKLDSNTKIKMINILKKIVETYVSWKVELRNPKVEVCIHVTSEGLFIGIPISIKPLSDRIHYSGMRTTVAYSMYFLLQKYCNNMSLVIDPFCGKGTILCEAHDKNTVVFGSDNQRAQLEIAQDQLKKFHYVLVDGVAVLLVSLTILDVLLYHATGETFSTSSRSIKPRLWKRLSSHYISLGKLDACVIVLLKN